MTPPAVSTGLELKGINYDVGTSYGDTPTRVSWHLDDVRRDLRTIRDDLHCTAVNLYGTDICRLTQAARIARETGLSVWLQPRLIDQRQDDVLAHLAEAAVAAEQVRRVHGDVVLNVGCELTVFAAGIIPGRGYNERSARLTRPQWWPALPWFSHQLNRLLARACDAARAEFAGPLSYSAGLWERVDWRRFDLIGLNYYRLKYNRRRYAQRLRRYHRHGKQVVITEFGCGSFDGAAELGPASHAIVQYGPAGPTLAPGYTRNEQEQADYLAELLATYRSVGVHGAFVFEFVEPYKPHSTDPGLDLDMAGYGIVKVRAGPPGEPIQWEPKAAFTEIARIYQESVLPPASQVVVQAANDQEVNEGAREQGASRCVRS